MSPFRSIYCIFCYVELFSIFFWMKWIKKNLFRLLCLANVASYPRNTTEPNCVPVNDRYFSVCLIKMNIFARSHLYSTFSIENLSQIRQVCTYLENLALNGNTIYALRALCIVYDLIKYVKITTSTSTIPLVVLFRLHSSSFSIYIYIHTNSTDTFPILLFFFFLLTLNFFRSTSVAFRNAGFEID